MHLQNQTLRLSLVTWMYTTVNLLCWANGNHHTFKGYSEKCHWRESGTEYLSPCGGIGRGPWPLDRSILGDSGGRPGILLSRPVERGRIGAHLFTSETSDQISGHPVSRDLYHNHICKSHTLYQLTEGVFLTDNKFALLCVLFTFVRWHRYPLTERGRGSLFIGRKVPLPIASVGLLLK